jgi:hypothetical protein
MLKVCSNDLSFWKICFEHEAFVPKFDTHFVKKYYAEVLKKQMEQKVEIAAMVALKLTIEEKIIRLLN